MRRKITNTREDLNGKTLNTISSKNKRPKLNNLNEFDSNKWTKEIFSPDKFIYFKNRDKNR